MRGEGSRVRMEGTEGRSEAYQQGGLAGERVEAGREGGKNSFTAGVFQVKPGTSEQGRHRDKRTEQKQGGACAKPTFPKNYGKHPVRVEE